MSGMMRSDAGNPLESSPSTDILVTVKRPKKAGGFIFQDATVPLTPGDSDRLSFASGDSTSRKSAIELAAEAKSLFPIHRVFLSKDHLCDALNCFGQGYFSVCRYGVSFECSAGPAHPKTKKQKDLDDSDPEEPTAHMQGKKTRGKGQASIKIGCSFKINFIYVKRKDYGGPVIITGANYDHDKCLASVEMYRAVHLKSHAPFHNISHNAMTHLCWSLHRNPHTDYKSIRNIVKDYIPQGFTLGPYEVRNLRNRVQNFFSAGERKLAFAEFEQKINGGESTIWNGINLFSHVDAGDSSLIISDIHEQLLGENASEHIFLLEEFLERIAAKDKGFTFKMWCNDDGQFIGAVWMTSFMRANAELFGSYICLDMCMRELNAVNWPYAAITCRDEFDCVAVILDQNI